MRFYSLGIYLIIFISLEAVAVPFQYQLRAINKEQRAKIANLGFALENITNEEVTVYGTEQDLKTLQFTKQLLSYQPLSQKQLTDFPGYDEQFHNYQELITKLQDLEQRFPHLIQLNSLGMSLERRLIPHVILTENPSQSSNKPAVAFLGGHHAREHLSIELPLGIIDHFIKKYTEGDKDIQQLLANRVIHIIPVVNPDGAEYDISEGDYKWWRKNRRVMNEAIGVDLNRNYDFAWGTTGTSTNPRSDVYCGPSPFSEMESQAIKNFIETHNNISILVSFHTFSELILYPWGHTYDRIPNQTDYMVHKTMAEKMAEWNGYTPQQSSELYPASGDTTDWTYGVHGIFSFTFELDPKNRWDGGFYPGQSYIDRVIEKNLNPIIYLTELADNPYRVLETTSKQYGLHSPLLK